MKNFYLILFFLATFSNVFSQTDRPEPYSSVDRAILIVPQYAAVAGLRVDIENKLKKNDNWLVFSPQIFFDNNGYRDVDEMRGIGLNISFKKYLHHSVFSRKNGNPFSSIYFMSGPTFQHISMVEIDQVPVMFTEEGRNYLRFSEQDVKTPIYRYGANALFGLQVNKSRFVLDFYGGIGFRYSVDNNGDLIDTFKSSWIDFGYSGVMLEGGVRFGFFI